MSIKIEVTGDSLPEIADKLLALASQFSKQALPFDPPATPVEDKPKQTRKSKKAEEAQSDVEGNAEAAETAPTPAEPAAKTESTPDAPSEAPTLDFDKDVAPVVIEAVQKAGREGVSAVLTEFGAERASEVDPSLWPELTQKLKAL